MADQRLPQIGGDSGVWGDILNGYLLVSHAADGTLLPAAVSAAGAYVKPVSGIPTSDLSSSVQTSLANANTALQSAPVTSVNGHTGAVSLTKSDVGLGNVQNLAVLVLGPSDPVPAGTPAGTVILRTT